MKKVYLSLFLMCCLAGSLLAVKNWNIYTNTSHVSAMTKLGDNYYLSTSGGMLIYNLEQHQFLKTMTNIDGLSASNLRFITTDPNTNTVLICTNQNGVDIFDGTDFRIPITETSGLLSNQTRKIVFNGDKFYIVTTKGLSVFINSPELPIPLFLKNYDENSVELNTGIINDLIVTPDNYLNIATEHDLIRVHADSLYNQSLWRHYNISGNSSITSLASWKNKLVVGMNNKLMTFDFSTISPQSETLETNLHILNLLGDSQDNLWVSYGEWIEDEMRVKNDSNLLIRKYNSNADTLSWRKNQAGLTDKAIYRFQEIDNRVLALCWGDGFYTFYHNIWINFSSNCMVANFVKTVKIDKENKIWVANGSRQAGYTAQGTRGVSCFDGDVWTNYTAQNSDLHSDNIYTIGIDEQNRKWFGSWYTAYTGEMGWQNGFSVLKATPNGEQWNVFNQNNSGIGALCFSNIQAINDTTIYVSAITDSVYIFNDHLVKVGSFRVYGDQNHEVYAIHKSNSRIFFSSSSNGIAIWTRLDKTPSLYGAYWETPTASELRTCFVYDIESYTINDVEQTWFATDKGVFMYDGSYWYKYDRDIKRRTWKDSVWESELTNVYYYIDEERIFGSNSTVPTCLDIDAYGRVWIGSETQGITCYDLTTERFTNFNKANCPLLSDNITCLTYSQHNGILFIGTPIGLNSVEIGTPEPSFDKYQSVRVYPNPFYPEKKQKPKNDNGESTVIISNNNADFSGDFTTCSIFDLSGDLVVKLELDKYKQFSWTGNNEKGKKCSSGIYLFIIKNSLNATIRGKIALLR